MTQSEHSAPGIDTRLSRLSTRITVIVFWVLALTGLAFAIFLLKDADTKITDQRNKLLDQGSTQLEQVLAAYPDPRTAPLDNILTDLRRQYGVEAVALVSGDEVLQVSGQQRTGLQLLQHAVIYHARGAANNVYSALQIKLYFPPLQESVDEQRRWALFGLGLMFLVFGVALRKILSLVLSKPVLTMVQTAQEISRGNSDLRFDKSRDDEFGYLAGFINEALESLTEKQDQVRGALEHIQESEAALFREKELAQVTLHSIGDGVITADQNGDVSYINAAAQRLTGWSTQDALGRPLREVMPVIDEVTRAPLEHPAHTCLHTGAAVAQGTHTVLRRREGELIPVSVSAAPIRDHAGAVLGSVTAFQDVSEARDLQRELVYLASHDPLTGLCNRREFEIELERTLALARRYNHEHALCYLDLDQFKLVNDTCGHIAGDELLRQLSTHLKARVRSSDAFARLGGDEFGILLSHCDITQAAQLADGIRNDIKAFKFTWEGKPFEIGASIGLVAVNAESQSVAELLSAADVACYMAKDAGRNRVHIYRSNDTELTQRRGEMALVGKIGEALAQQRLQLYCQAIVPTTGKPNSHRHFEVLLRMFDETGAMLSPAQFIPAAERYNLMGALDRWVVESTLKFLHAHNAELADLSLSINLSGQSLCDDVFLNFVVDQIASCDVAPERICFEITETAVIANIQLAKRFITVLRSMGCKFALDDFGSGLSSFGYLKTLPVDYLKIDGSLVRHIAEYPVDRAMVFAIAQIGSVMGIKTVAEFVENEAIFTVLQEINIDYAQGYWIGKPQPLDNLIGVATARSA